jgi:hypothetical protein
VSRAERFDLRLLDPPMRFPLLRLRMIWSRTVDGDPGTGGFGRRSSRQSAKSPEVGHVEELVEPRHAAITGWQEHVREVCVGLAFVRVSRAGAERDDGDLQLVEDP